MTPIIHRTIYATLISAALFGAPVAALAEDGTQQMQQLPQQQTAVPADRNVYSETAPGSWTNFPAANAAPVSSDNPSFAGPRPSSAH